MVPDWLNLLACGITVASGGHAVHGSVAGFRRARKIDAANDAMLYRLEQLDGQIASLDGKLSRLSENVFASDHVGITLTAGEAPADRIAPDRMQGLCSGADLIVDRPVSSSDGLLKRFEEAPDDFLVGIRPLTSENDDLSLLQDPTMVPWHFQKWGMDLVGFAKRGFIDSLGVTYRPIPLGQFPARTVPLGAGQVGGGPGRQADGDLTHVQPAILHLLRKQNQRYHATLETPRISVFGIGGAGSNAVNNMIAKAMAGVEFVVANTDTGQLAKSRAENRIQLGARVAEGMAAGGRAAVGAAAAEESIEQIVDHLAGVDMCFITAGMGGGTGTGATPIVAQAARELGCLTIGVVTKPFQFEGAKRMRQAEDGIECLQRVVDTLIVIPNQNLFRLANENTTFTEAFSIADDVLYRAIAGFSDVMTQPGLVNLEFPDIKALLGFSGTATVGFGTAEGAQPARDAVSSALSNPLLEPLNGRTARSVLVNVMGDQDLGLADLEQALACIHEQFGPETEVHLGSTTRNLGKGRVSVWLFVTDGTGT
ncbi:cell division protein FtsZ [Mameliella sediminis]|uniref:cell division protein FtsZ n=1 Tax=Mameliella sediminis TaxID=2836866 RepID=UPI001FE4237A|nr:cell division protein FtsZ [Mameliella sediminis]